MSTRRSGTPARCRSTPVELKRLITLWSSKRSRTLKNYCHWQKQPLGRTLLKQGSTKTSLTRPITMQMHSFSRLVAAIAIAATAIPMVAVSAQQPKKKKGEAKVLKPPRDPGSFFKSEQPITFTLTANIGRLKKDKGEKKPWRWGQVTYVD